MKTIEINTAQKVTIQYELASLSNRAVAYLVDWLVLGGVLTVLTILGDEFTHSNTSYNLFLYVIIAPIIFLYTLVLEVLLDGQTIGKKALGIKIVKLNGDTPSIYDYVMRWLFRFVDIMLSLGAIAALLINSSPKKQRLGGLLSGTTVIRTSSTRTFTLNDILNISTIDTYTPTYLEVRKFNEKEMLFIKKVLERERRYPNLSHKKAVKELAIHMAKQIDLMKIPKDKNKFLRTLINDYIVLTR